MFIIYNNYKYDNSYIFIKKIQIISISQYKRNFFKYVLFILREKKEHYY